MIDWLIIAGFSAAAVSLVVCIALILQREVEDE